MNNSLYKEPKVKLLNNTPLWVAEVAARTAYDSFDKSENKNIQNFKYNGKYDSDKDINSSELLENLSWVYFHHSVLEHVVLQYHIKDIGRGVLQELARHRMASLTVRSTRYTLGPIIIALIVSKAYSTSFVNYVVFAEILDDLDFSVLKKENKDIYDDEIYSIYIRLESMYVENKNEFINMALTKSQKDILDNIELFKEPKELYKALMDAKMKRNLGDNFKFIVTDNFKTELIWTINLRSLKNFLGLRAVGSAWKPMQDLAIAIKNQTPKRFLKLIWKDKNEK